MNPIFLADKKSRTPGLLPCIVQPVWLAREVCGIWSPFTKQRGAEFVISRRSFITPKWHSDLNLYLLYIWVPNHTGTADLRPGLHWGWVGMPGLEAVFVQSPRAISRSRLNRRKVIQWRRGRTWRILVARKASSWDQWNRTTSSSAEWSRGSHKEWIARTNWPGARNVRRMQLCKCRKMSHGERR